MSFDLIEISDESGKPIELYEFVQGNYPDVRTYFYNTSDRAITVAAPAPWTGDRTYLPVPISNAGLAGQTGTDETEVAITLPLSADVCRLFDGTPPSVPIKAVIKRMHYGDADAEVVIYWMGQIANRVVPQDGEATFNCNTLVQTFARAGLRLAYSRQCPYVVYAPTTCKAALVPVTATITALTGNSVTADAFALSADGKFSGGFVQWSVVGALMEYRTIDTHVGTTIVLLGYTDGLTVGQEITAFIGCARNRQVCLDDHDNLPNYGGFAHMPGKSPYDGEPVF